ncbi:TPA: hypothetical protein NG630_004433 [Vibrio parahaemolyticus]|nr:hypothetical protein [Vibrio parahaemolyticus]
MLIEIETITINDKHYRAIKKFNGFILAQEVVTVREPFTDAVVTLSDVYTLLNENGVIAESSTKEFSSLVKALDAFKVA